MIYLKLIWSYLKIGLFGFGGGYAMLTLIEREIVGNGWITSTMFTDIVAISQMTPGPIGINSAIYRLCGSRRGRPRVCIPAVGIARFDNMHPDRRFAFLSVGALHFPPDSTP